MSCTLENLKAKWLLSISSGLEWAELDDVLNQIQDGAICARAGEFRMRAPILANSEMQDYSLTVQSAHFYFSESDFGDLVDVLRRAWDLCNTENIGGSIAHG
jgi:hypothetical protein